MSRALIAVFLSALVADGARAQDAPTPYAISATRVTPFESASVGAAYELHVALPAGGDVQPGLPLVVLLDSNQDFPLVTAISRRLQAAGALPDFILIGVGYPEFPMYYRSRDYTPSRGGHPDRPSGGAPDFVRFLSSELVPWAEREYETSGTRVLVGHSLGGLLGVFAMSEEPSLFTAVIASSPAVWWGDHEVVDGLAVPFALDHTRLFLSLGAEETDTMTSGWERLAEKLRARAQPMTFEAQVFPDEDHSSVKPMAFSRGLRWVFGSGGVDRSPSS